MFHLVEVQGYHEFRTSQRTTGMAALAAVYHSYDIPAHLRSRFFQILQVHFELGNCGAKVGFKGDFFIGKRASQPICVYCVDMAIDKPHKQYFTRQLMHWHGTDNFRDLPWKGEKDPYKIWLSEIILQQTRALQGLPYYLGFTKRYPSVQSLAKAKDEDAFRLWQGLGYYNRCKNMLATARYITDELKGQFPDTYEGLLALKGVGPYTAAAIGSFAYGLPEAVVDGNVNRILARYFGIDTPFNSTEGKKQFGTLARELLYTNDSSAYNQAIMDLGATVCTPGNPKCGECPLAKKCIAYQNDIIADLPVKVRKAAVRKRYFHYILFVSGQKIWLQQRTGKDIWQNLYEPYLIEHEKALDTKELSKLPELKGEKFTIAHSGSSNQRLTHQIIETSFFTIHIPSGSYSPSDKGKWVLVRDLKKYAFPKTVLSFLENNFYF